MMVLLVLKERLKSFYGKYAVVTKGLVKFALAFLSVVLLKQNLGYSGSLNSSWAALGIGIVCAFLPYGAISFLMAAVMLVHIYTVSFEIALLTAVILIVIALLYYGFHPGDSYWLVLTPIAFICKMPYAIPLLAGLSGSMLSVIPVCCGVLVYYILTYVKQNAGILTNDTSVDITQKYLQLMKNLVSNKEMMIMMVACAIGILFVFIVHNLSVDYAWAIAIVMGVIAQLGVVFVGDFLFDVSVSFGEVVLGVIFSLILSAIYHFFVFAVDYSRTEYTQFEDDDYVYYVKAVPKIVVSKPEVRVQRINNPPRPPRRTH